MALEFPPWRKRAAFYVLVVVVAALGIHYMERVPNEYEIVFILTGLDVKADGRRFDRAQLIDLTAEIADDGETVARSTFSFRAGAPLQTSPVLVRLRRGEHDVHFRMVFADAGSERTFALHRRFEVGKERDGGIIFVDVR